MIAPLPIADDSQCPAHPELAVTAICDRCGTFMCERCHRYHTETRCKSCRPKRKAPELEERRANAVRRSETIRCLGCEYRGPRLDSYQPLRWYVAALLPLACAFGLWPGMMLLTSAEEKVHPCPGCGEATQVYPLVTDAVIELEPSALEAFTRLQNEANATRRRNYVKIGGTLVLWGGAVFAVFRLM